MPPKKHIPSFLGFLFCVVLKELYHGKSPSFTTIWDSVFGTFSKHLTCKSESWGKWHPDIPMTNSDPWEISYRITDPWMVDSYDTCMYIGRYHQMEDPIGFWMVSDILDWVHPFPGCWLVSTRIFSAFFLFGDPELKLCLPLILLWIGFGVVKI